MTDIKNFFFWLRRYVTMPARQLANSGCARPQSPQGSFHFTPLTGSASSGLSGHECLG